ncbi:hypothetical protein [Phenylobacterium immobile]|uniref:hypothetical protein n=1 Tax=Phenylobacterium immobile TaxID=21 RepID=UPI00159EC5AB|nr:hypothetical protein [Phenylobacterium immobile]
MFSPAFPRAMLGALLLMTAACNGDPRSTASEDVHRFLTAVAADDRPGFEALVDRPAVRGDLRRQIISVAKAEGVEIEGGPSDFALDRMVAPATLRLVEAAEGRVEPPDAKTLAGLLKTLDDGSVCLPAAGQADRCVLTFRSDGKSPFRLVAMRAAEAAPIQPSVS